MLRLVLLIAACVCALGTPLALQPRNTPGSRIIGGDRVDIEEVPYQLSFEADGWHFCGAAIISADWVVTTASCAYILNSDVTFRSGSSEIGRGGVVHIGGLVFFHEKYVINRDDYDIALIQVNPPFTMSNNTAAIPLATVAPPAGTAASITGWGFTSPDSNVLVRHLRRVEVPVYDQAACSEAYGQYGDVTAQMLCAGPEEGGKGFCVADSGGPLQAGGELVGLASWGKGCGDPGYPGVYTNVAAFRSWIYDRIGV